MPQNEEIKVALTSVINGLFQSIEADNEEKSQGLIDELCELYEEHGDNYYQTAMHLEMMRLKGLPAKPFLRKHPEVAGWDKFYIESIYNGIFSHWIRRMIVAFEGSPCSADKEDFVTACVVQSIIEQRNISLYRTYGDYGEKYDDGKTELNRQVYWSPSCFKDTDEVKVKFKHWWRVIEDD